MNISEYKKQTVNFRASIPHTELRYSNTKDRFSSVITMLENHRQEKEAKSRFEESNKSTLSNRISSETIKSIETENCNDEMGKNYSLISNDRSRFENNNERRQPQKSYEQLGKDFNLNDNLDFGNTLIEQSQVIYIIILENKRINKYSS